MSFEDQDDADLANAKSLFAGVYCSHLKINPTCSELKIPRKIGIAWFNEPDMKRAIQKKMDKRAKRLDIKADNILREIGEIVQECRVDKNHKDALKGLELLGKHLKLFTDKVEHTGNTVSFNLNLGGGDSFNNLPDMKDVLSQPMLGEEEPEETPNTPKFELPEELQSLSEEELEIMNNPVYEYDEADDDETDVPPWSLNIPLTK